MFLKRSFTITFYWFELTYQTSIISNQQSHKLRTTQYMNVTGKITECDPSSDPTIEPHSREIPRKIFFDQIRTKLKKIDYKKPFYQLLKVFKNKSIDSGNSKIVGKTRL